MENHLERTAKLVVENKGLYRWAIQEFSAEGKKFDRDLIPWSWTLGFTADEVSVVEAIQTKDFQFRESDKSVKRTIHAALKPTKGEFGPVRYSMIGTDRRIEDIAIRVEPLGSEDEPESCTVWGVVAYTAEWDFRKEEQPDSMGFRLLIKPSSFDRLADLIAEGQLAGFAFQVSGVRGFYSDWSPSIRTTFVKVLTGDEKGQPIEMEEGSEIDLLRLDVVRDFSLTFTSKAEIPVIPTDESEIVQEDDKPTPEAEVLASLDRMTLAMGAYGRRLGALTSLQWAAWITVLVLVVIAFKGCGA